MSNHLLLIAIGKYKHWHTLDGPKRDADALKTVLFQKYGFSSERTIELRDAAATNENILKAFRQWKDASPEDQLLIYYAGHGHTDDFDKTGFWIPHDAERDTGQRVRWIPNASIRGALAVLPFHHILLICDSCFSGDLLDLQRGVSINQNPPAKPDYIKNSLRKRSREVLTSGSSEPVSDVGLTGHSAFAFHLIDTLKTNPEPWIDAIRLYDHIRCGVSGQQPLYGWLNSAGHQRGGAFVFIDVKADRWPTTDDTKETAHRKGTSRSLQDTEVTDANAALDDSDQRTALSSKPTETKSRGIFLGSSSPGGLVVQAETTLDAMARVIDVQNSGRKPGFALIKPRDQSESSLFYSTATGIVVDGLIKRGCMVLNEDDALCFVTVRVAETRGFWNTRLTAFNVAVCTGLSRRDFLGQKGADPAFKSILFQGTIRL